MNVMHSVGSFPATMQQLRHMLHDPDSIEVFNQRVKKLGVIKTR
jgi:hypothetical protein